MWDAKLASNGRRFADIAKKLGYNSSRLFAAAYEQGAS